MSEELKAEELKTDVKFVEVTWERAIKVWWSLIWRGVLFSLLAGFVIGLIFGFISVFIGLDANTTKAIAQILGLIVAIPIGIAITKIVLKKKYSDFRIALIEK